MQDTFKEGKNLTLNTKNKIEITNSDDKQLPFTGETSHSCKHMQTLNTIICAFNTQSNLFFKWKNIII